MKNWFKAFFSESATATDDKAKQQEVIERVNLLETTVRSDGTLPIKIITPGWGSSGYYSEDVLRRYAGMYKEGTHMYLDHPSESEEWERPERSVRDLAGTLASDAYYNENGPSGPGVYADAKVIESIRPLIEEIGKHIGLSHRAQGMAKYGEAEGQEGLIVETIDKVISVDFVTLPGRGGEVVQLMESLRESKNQKEDDDLKWSELTSQGLKENRKDLIESVENPLKESITQKDGVIDNLTKKNKELLQEQGYMKVEKLVEKHAEEKHLPDAAKQRIKESFKNSVPLKEGAVDLERAEQDIRARVESEAKYIESLGVTHNVNLGESATQNQDVSEDELVESFKQMGLNEADAKAAAKGRV